MQAVFLDLSTEHYPALKEHCSLVLSQEKAAAGGAFQGFRKLLKAKIEFALSDMEVSLCFAVKCWDGCSA